jgi:hypothetical protein
MHRSRPGARRAPRFLAAIAVAATFVLLQPSPATAQTAPWGTFPAVGAVSSNGATPMVVLVGDSLIVGPGVQPVADHFRAATGRTSYVSAAGGASFVTYAWPGQQAGNALVFDYANFFRPGVTVMALGTNDVRVMTQAPAHYNASSQKAVMAHAVQQSKLYSTCILLVNVRSRSDVPQGQFSNTHVASVNSNMSQVAASYADGRVRVANWNSYSAGQSSWFLPADVHHTAAGQLYYVQLIRQQTIALQQQKGC